MMSKPVSYIKTENGTQVLYVNGKPLEGLAYITYLSDKNCYKDFADAYLAVENLIHRIFLQLTISTTWQSNVMAQYNCCRTTMKNSGCL